MEAVLDLRFELGATVPEVLYGRFADFAAWDGFAQARLPTADVPAPIRRMNPGLRYSPSIAFTAPDGTISARIGPQTMQYSRIGSYPGWSVFGPELEAAIAHLFKVAPSIRITRCGLRYINALREDVHGISSIEEMDIDVSVAGSIISTGLNLNFKSDVGTEHESMTRVATVDLAEGSIPPHTSIIVDIDVYTMAGYGTTREQDVRDWLSVAHDKEKRDFFRVLGPAITERLRED